MTAANCRVDGIIYADCDPMFPAPGPNAASNASGQPNVPNYYLCGGNEQNVNTIYSCSADSGGITGCGTGTRDGYAKLMQGSGKYFIKGAPATRLGDAGYTNCGNVCCYQAKPCQTKCYINA